MYFSSGSSTPSVPLPLQPFAPFRVPSDTLVRSTKLSLIHSTLDPRSLPASYQSNTAKEEALLEFAEDFRRQFVQIFPTRRPLLLSPFNECNIRKFICSAVQPCKLPYTDLYDYARLTEFVHDFLTYLPFDDPVHFPDLLPSLSTILQTRCADSLDFACLLVSFLRGNGYNAMVCLGIAPEYITNCNLKGVQCPLLVDEKRRKQEEAMEAQRRAEEEERAKVKYLVPNKPKFESKYVKAREEEKRQKELELRQKALKNERDEMERKRQLQAQAMDITLVNTSNQLSNATSQGQGVGGSLPSYSSSNFSLVDNDITDPLHGQRVHAWVLLLPNRRHNHVNSSSSTGSGVTGSGSATGSSGSSNTSGTGSSTGSGSSTSDRDHDVPQPLFLDPGTGFIFNMQNHPYLALDAVFNDQNYYVNLQQYGSIIDYSNGQLMPFNWDPVASKASSTAPKTELSWDFQNSKYWEYILIDESKVQKSQKGLHSHPMSASAANSSAGGSGSSASGVGGGSSSSGSSGAGNASSGGDSTASNGVNPSNSSGGSSATGSSGAGGFDFSTETPEELQFRLQNLSPEEKYSAEQHVLDLNPSYQLKSFATRWIPYELYLARYPYQSKCEEYNGCTVEKYSPYTIETLGCIQRLILRDKMEWNEIPDTLDRRLLDSTTLQALQSGTMQEPIEIVSEVRELYRHRKDGLVKKWIYPLLKRVGYEFEPGKHNGLKEYWMDYESIIGGNNGNDNEESSSSSSSSYASPFDMNSLVSPSASASIASSSDTPKIRRREFVFYPGARSDGLIRRIEDCGCKIVEYYEKRDDFLEYRSITFENPLNPTVINVPIMSPSNGLINQTKKASNNANTGAGGSSAASAATAAAASSSSTLKPSEFYIETHEKWLVKKLCEKYRRNVSIPSEKDIRKITFHLLEQTIRLDYHYLDAGISHSRHYIDKLDKLEQSETEGPQANSRGYLLRITPDWKERNRGEEQKFIGRLLNWEKELKVRVKEEEFRMFELVKTLDGCEERDGVELVRFLYDQAKEEAKKWSVQQKEREREREKEKEKERERERERESKDSIGYHQGRSQGHSGPSGVVENDYLAPYLSEYPIGKVLTKRQALSVKEACLASLKERLLERANIIQQHLDEEQGKLHARQALFKRQAAGGVGVGVGVGVGNTNGASTGGAATGAGAGAGATSTMTAAELTEEFNQFMEETMFRIDILNARRARHEEMALKKYVELDEKLNNDPRLSALHSAD